MARAELQMAYFAGLIDGEGCLTVTRQKRNTQPTVTVMVSMTTPEPLRLLKEEFGGSLCEYQRALQHKPVWMYRCQAKKAEVLIRAIRPFLIVKAEQADLCLELRDSMSGGGILPRGSHVDAEKTARITEFRESIVTRMRVLNHRGVINA